MGSKSIAVSKTIIVNTLTTVMALGAVLSGNATVMGWISAHPKISAGVMATMGIANILLRLMTNQPVTLTGAPVAPNGNQ